MDELIIEVQVGGSVQVQGTTANVFIFDDIGTWYGYSKMDLIKLFRGGNITAANIYINSPGGNLETALSMYDLIKGSVGITTTAYLLGQCASAATVIACATDRVVMSEQCLYLVHKPMKGSGGNADDLRQDAEYLDTWESVMVNLYQRKTGLDIGAIQDILRQDAYINAPTALALGFVDETVEAIEIDWTLPASGGERFDWMTSSEYWNSAKDTEISMTGAATFRSTIYNCLTEGKHILQMPQKINNMNVFQKIVTALAGKGLIEKGKEAEAVTALSESGTLDEIVNAAVAEIRNSTEEPAAVEPTPMTADDVLTAINGLTDEQLEGLKTRLGIVAPQADSQLAEVNNTVQALSAQVASIVKNRAGVPPSTNGISDVPVPAAKTETPYNSQQLAYLVSAFDRNQLTDDDFVRATKVTIAQAREILAN